jgi:spermidine/putrescine transport system substrate-binding protein
VLLTVFVAGILAASLLVFTACNDDTDELVVYNWADYISPDALEGFDDYYFEQTGRHVNVVYSTFDTNENMITTLLNGKEEVDLVCPSDYAIEKLLKQDFLQPLDKDKIPNLDNVYPFITEKVESVFGDIVSPDGYTLPDYYAPYMWGTLGILYNTEIVSEEELEEVGWGILWNAASNPKLDGKILVKDSIRDTYCATVTYLMQENRIPAKHRGKSLEELINTVDAEMLAAVEAALQDQKKHLKGYEVDFGKDDMITGAAYVDLAWSGDAIYAIEEGELEGVSLAYYVPEIGTNLWFDGWVMPKNAPNPDAAHIFINYMFEPTTAIMNSMEVGYVNSLDPEILKADPEVLAILADNEYIYFDEDADFDNLQYADILYDDEADELMDYFFTDPARYPDINDDNAEIYGVMKDFDAQNDTAVSMWERVKAGMGEDEDGLGELAVPVWILVSVAALFAVVAAGYLIAQRLKRRPRVS